MSLDASSSPSTSSSNGTPATVGPVHGAWHGAALQAELDRRGHGYGGAVVSGATPPADVRSAVVYVAAFAPVAGESVSDLMRSNRFTDSVLADSIVMDDHGCSTLDPSGAITALYGESPDPARRAAVARLEPQLMSSFTEPIETSVIERVARDGIAR
jgi:hypothetical protein